MREVKMFGQRSFRSKMIRLATELKNDAARIRTYGTKNGSIDGASCEYLIAEIELIAANLRKLTDDVTQLRQAGDVETWGTKS